MWQRIFRRLFSRKLELLILGIIIAGCALVSKTISINHWQELNWVIPGYHPFVPVVGLIWMGAFMLVMYLRKIRAPSLWFMGIVGCAYSLILFWALWLR